MKRLFDVVLSLCGLAVFGAPILVIALLVKLTSRGPALYWSDRIGRNNVIFKMPKFRTMCVNTPAVATHLLAEPDRFVTPVGKFLRRSSLDELPQFFSILKGDMSFVGPRPALFNQDDLRGIAGQLGGLAIRAAKPAGPRLTAGMICRYLLRLNTTNIT